jgi:hypothetical protein
MEWGTHACRGAPCGLLGSAFALQRGVGRACAGLPAAGAPQPGPHRPAAAHGRRRFKIRAPASTRPGTWHMGVCHLDLRCSRLPAALGGHAALPGPASRLFSGLLSQGWEVTTMVRREVGDVECTTPLGSNGGPLGFRLHPCSVANAHFGSKVRSELAWPPGRHKGERVKSPPIIGSGQTIEEELEALRHHVAHYRNVLNDEGIWLFLATLGCWGVTFGPIRLVAFGLAIAIFGKRMSIRSTETRTFSELAVAIEKKIDALIPEGDTRKARLYDLASYRKTELSTLKSLRNTSSFLMSWCFFAISFGWALFNINK